MTQETLILGGGTVGLELAAELAGRNQAVAIVDGESMTTRARDTGLIAHQSTLETATPPGDHSAETVVVATPSDARNLLLAMSAPRVFDADRVVALVNDPQKRAAFEDAGIETVCVSQAVARATSDSIAVEEAPPVDRPTETDERVKVRE